MEIDLTPQLVDAFDIAKQVFPALKICEKDELFGRRRGENYIEGSWFAIFPRVTEIEYSAMCLDVCVDYCNKANEARYVQIVTEVGNE